MTRIVLCTSGGLYGSLVMSRMLARTDVRIVGVVNSTRVLHPGYGWLRGAISQLRRSGPAYSIYLGCATVLSDMLGRFSGRASVSMNARRRDIPLCATRDVNGAVERDFIARLRPDLLVSAFFNQRIGTEVCAIPRAGAVNIHPSLLPAFKGVDPVFFARLRRAARFGVTVHRVAAEFDTGPVLAQTEVMVDDTASVMAVTAKLFFHGVGQLFDCLPAIQDGEPGQTQDSGGSYDSWPTPEQVQIFRGQGNRLIRLADMKLLSTGALSMLAAEESQQRSGSASNGVKS